MRIAKPKISKLNTGTAREGAYGNGKGAGTAGQVKSGHHFHAVQAGGEAPRFTRQGNAAVNAGWTDRRRNAKKMF